MIRRHQLTRPSLLPFRALQVAVLSGSTRGLAWLSLASLLALSAPVSAQITPDNAGDRIEFHVSSDQPVLEPLGLDAVTSIQDEPQSFVIWDHGAGTCCGDCRPTWRVRAEALSLDMEVHSGLSLSNQSGLRDFGYEQGTRLSLVRRLDCLDAWELAYVGPFEWEEFGQVNGVGLTSRLNSTTVNLSEFDNATFHSHSYRSRLNSVEVNRRWYGWDVISTLAGLRYMKVDEEFAFNSTGAAGAGLLAIETHNDMIGPQVGLELNYPLGNWMTTATAKGAVMVNSADDNFLLVNAGVVEVANTDDELQFSSVIELGYTISYQITPHIAVRGGYELWWLYGFAQAPAQLADPITPLTGSAIVSDENVFYHGASFGFEAVW